jgi:hypothetical protein
MITKKRFIYCLYLFLFQFSGAALGQDAVQTSDEEKAIKTTVQLLFDGMRTGDSAMVRQAFHPDARLVTSYMNREKIPQLETTSLQEFLEAVGSPHDIVWDEQLISQELKIDRTMAQIWAPYRFFAGTTFSHCGVNAIQLVKTDQGWKILYITDTRSTDCP